LRYLFAKGRLFAPLIRDQAGTLRLRRNRWSMSHARILGPAPDRCGAATATFTVVNRGRDSWP
jgi:hypothetical protein